MKKVISVSFFRHPKSVYETPQVGESQGVFFVRELPGMIRGHHSVFPEWELWIHHDERVREFSYFAALERMHEEGLVRLVPVGEAPSLCGAMLWRMKPIWDASVDVTLCRDVDALATPREGRVVKRWMEGITPVLSLHDNVVHPANVVMGGMVGFRTPQGEPDWFTQTIGSSWDHLVSKARQNNINLNAHGADQLLLNALKLPKQMMRVETHDSMPARSEERDELTAHIGGVFEWEKVRDWYDAHPDFCGPVKRIQECEEGVTIP